MKSAVCLIAIFIGALHPSHEPLELPISRGFFTGTAHKHPSDTE